MTSIARPSTPVLVETTNLYLHDHETIPRTPPHRMPLMFRDCPPAPRPRKRIFQPSNLDEMADLFLPTAAALDDGVPDLLPETPKHSSSSSTVTARPAPKRLLRRSLYQNRRLRIAVDTSIDIADENENSNDANNEDPVRIQFRRSLNNAELTKSATGDDDSDGAIKLWPATPTQVSKVSLKRRNSYNALCA